MMIVGKGVITGIMEEAGVVAIPLTITTEAMLMMSISEGVTLLKGFTYIFNILYDFSFFFAFCWSPHPFTKP